MEIGRGYDERESYEIVKLDNDYLPVIDQPSSVDLAMGPRPGLKHRTTLVCLLLLIQDASQQIVVELPTPRKAALLANSTKGCSLFNNQSNLDEVHNSLHVEFTHSPHTHNAGDACFVASRISVASRCWPTRQCGVLRYFVEN
eukprot:scaffold2659_cov107-Cylindrotheca_fusiformis.AAC.2